VTGRADTGQEDLMRSSLFRAGVVLVALAALVSTPRSQAAAPPPATLKTVSYNVSDLIYQPGRGSGYDRIEEIVRELVRGTGGHHWRPGSSHRLEVSNDTTLEVTTTAAQHQEVHELLEMLRRSLDVAVDLEAELYELDRTTYEKEYRKRLENRFAAFAPTEVLRSKGNRVKAGRALLGTGRSASLLSLQQAFTYVARPAGAVRDPDKVYDVGYEGLRVRAKTTVSPDRRFVRLRLDCTITELMRMGKQSAFDPKALRNVKIDEPDLREHTWSGTVTVPDGLSLLLVVPRKKALPENRVQMLLIRPAIFIKEERRELLKDAM
jgi:hypothetical protein